MARNTTLEILTVIGRVDMFLADCIMQLDSGTTMSVKQASIMAYARPGYLSVESSEL